MQKPTWNMVGRATNFLMWCVALCVLTLSIVLLKQNHNLRAELDFLRAGRIVEGQQLHDLAAVSVDGYLRPIVPPNSPAERLLIIGFSPTCKFCEANLSGWRALAHAITGRKGWHVIWVSRDPIALTAEYSKAREIPSDEVLAEPPEATYSQLGLRAVPKTIVVGPGGIVERVWSGQLNTSAWRDVFSYLNIPDPVVAPSTWNRNEENAAPKVARFEGSK